jgi:ComF family protein
MKTKNQNRHDSWWDSFMALLFPRLCLACDQPLPFDEPYLCFDCQANLPETDFHLTVNNEFLDKMSVFFPLQAAVALFYFTKKSKTQHLIHRIKYEDKREVAVELGKWLGKKIVQQSAFKAIDCIVPVPMHPKKQRLRGYNQAELFANGISEATHWRVEKTALRKVKMTESQTRKSRMERSANVAEVFELSAPSLLTGKNILLVDDVMTTGATLDACASVILEALPQATISVATIAFAKNR